MLSKQEQAVLRGKLFRHLDGIVTAPSAYSLKEKGVLDHLLENEKCSLSELSKKFNANDGYLNVALRILCSQGWLEQSVDNSNNEVLFTINDKSAIAFDLAQHYKGAVEQLKLSEKYHSRKFEMEPFIYMEKLFANFKDNFGMTLSSDETEGNIQEQILAHVEGILVGPTLVRLGMTGMFHKYFMETRFKAEEFHEDADGFGRLLDIFKDLGWFSKSNDTYEFTDQGLFFSKRASAYGVTVSYIPTLRRLDDLIFGDALILKKQSANQEAHVDREMNVWGSGGAHSSYFKIIDEIVIDLFNRPIDEQPRGFLDMGCGNGAFLEHLFNVIERQTLRGSMLDEYPLSIIGVDYNEAALKVTKANLIKADIWAKVIWGDIGDPDKLAQDLKEDYKIDLKELLNVRTFLDHNRIWDEPTKTDGLRTSLSSGAYSFEGKRLNNNMVAESLRLHFEKWSQYVSKFGLILIELHTVRPENVAENLGKTAATAYDATHGYSDQFILEVDEFHEVLKTTGLHSDPSKFRKFPDSDLATVTVNLFKGE